MHLRLFLALFLPLVLSVRWPATAGAVTCAQTGFYRDGSNLTAAQIGGDVTGILDATGCHIGVYFGPGTGPWNVTGATIIGSSYYGVVNRGATVNVSDSTIRNIGETPFNGTQHGVAVYMATVDTGSPTAQPACTSGTTTGSIAGNTIEQYQKNGIVVSCSGSTVSVTGNTVTGLGPVDFIAQNGVQFGFGAAGNIRGNTITSHFYTGSAGVGPNPGGQNPPGWEYTSAGILLYQPGDVKHAQNHFADNQHNLSMVP